MDAIIAYLVCGEFGIAYRTYSRSVSKSSIVLKSFDFPRIPSFSILVTKAQKCDLFDPRSGVQAKIPDFHQGSHLPLVFRGYSTMLLRSDLAIVQYDVRRQ